MPNRINGIISGMDTEALVKAQVSYQQMQIDRLSKSNTKLTWQRETYRDIYTKINSYRDKMFNYKLESELKPRTAASSNENALTVKANADATVGVHKINVTQLAEGAQTGSQAGLGSTDNKASIQSQLKNPDGTSKYTGTITINLNGKDIAIDTSKSMNDMVKAINAAGTGVKASYDANVDRVFLSTEATGEEAKIDFSASSAAGKDFLTNGLQLGNVNTAMTGKNAEFSLDGVTGLEQSGNEFTISGITYNLKETGQSTVTIKNDNDGLLQKVKDFVEQYNTMIGSINDVIFQQKNKKFEPLTDAEKKEMTADQIKEWETKAKAGILHSDSILRGVANNMRTSIYTSIKGIDSKFNSLFAIGVRTGDYSTNGRLSIDEDKLKEAIEADPDAIAQIFNGGTDKGGQETTGVATKLYDLLKVGMDKIDAQSGASRGDRDVNSYLSRTISANQKTIDAKTKRMNAQMETYYKQYDAMEQLLAQMQKQQETLASYLGGS